jgi:hypothetical protein
MCLSRLRIESMLEFLRDMAKTWPYISALVGIFEKVIHSTGNVMPTDRMQIISRESSVPWLQNVQFPDKAYPFDNHAGNLISPLEILSSDSHFTYFNPNSLLDEVFHDSLQNIDFMNVSGN